MPPKVNLRGFYEQYFVITKDNVIGDELTVVCPFHEDTKPSLSINLETGLWKCHAQSCDSNDNGAGGGNTAKFYILTEAAEDRVVSYGDAVKYIGGNFGSTPEVADTRETPKPIANFPITEEEVKDKHETLLNSPKIMEQLRKIGWNEEVIRRFQIGINILEKRIWIPIREGGKLANIRKYSTKNKNKFLNIPKFGQARLWPDENLEGNEIFIFEGEKDCILANQLGINAVTVTGGAGTFKIEWAPLFQNKKVYVCYDIDLAGRKGAERTSKMLEMTASETHIIKLPITNPTNADFTDYILQGNTIDDFMALVSRSTEVVPEDASALSEEVYATTLDESTNKKYFFKRTRMKIRVICKHNPPYIIPKKLKLSCSRGNGKNCYACPMYKDTGADKDIDATTPDILEYVDSSNRQHRQIVESVFGIPKCNFFQYTIEERQAVEYFEAIPSLDETYDKDRDEKYTKAEFFLLDCTVEANTDYEIESIPVSDPRSQKLVYVGYKVQPCQSSIDEFILTDEIKQKLRIFQCQKLEIN